MAEDDDDLLDQAEIEALLNEAGAGQSPAAPPPAGAESADNSPSKNESQADGGNVGGDHLSQDDLDRLMAEATSGTASLDSPPKKPTAPPPVHPKAGEGDLLDPSEIEQLLSAKNSNASAAAGAAKKPAAQSNLSAGTEELLRQAEAGLAAAISSDGGKFSKPGPFGDPQPYTFQEFAKSQSDASNVALNTLHDVELDIRIELGRTELLIEEVLQLRDGSVVPLDKLAGDPVDVIVNERLIARGEVLVLNDNFCVRITEILPPHL